jgi:Tol biopolymer transport system component
MGEVYRAEDTRLHRVVALKTMSERLSSDAHAVERFEREARAAAALNHPNICTIYDVGTDPPFIAMEMLEGESLQQRLLRGPLDVAAAVDITLALVDALDAAHGKGILHRDIKPANIFLTPRGPKLLDFGLATSVPVAAVADAPGRAPTQAKLTDEGTTMGTVAYMSPEQLRGQPLDARSDLFSLGIVMYEMVTGRPAFTGETSAVVAAAILQEMPVLPRHIREDVPQRLEDIVLKTLEKDPRDRTQTAGELRADLRRFRREVESGSTVVQTTVGHRPSSGGAILDRARPGGAAAVRPRRWASALGGVLLAAAAAGVGYVAWQRGGGPAAPAGALLQNVQVSQVTVSGNAWRPALSPDGRYVVYVRRERSGRSLRMRQIGTDRDVELVAADPERVLQAAAVTPDGAFVDFVRGEPGALTLWRMPFLGGSPRRLIDRVSSPIGWSPDGRQLAFVRAGFDGASALILAAADGSNERELARRALPGQFLSFDSRGTPSAQGAGIHPAWSPDGRTIALIGFGPVDGVVTRQAIFVDVASGAARSIPLRDEASADGIEWLDRGRLIVSALGRNDAVAQLWLLSYPDGEWSRLTNDLANYASLGVSADRRSIVASRWDYRVGISVRDDASSEPVEVIPPSPAVGEDLGWAGDTLLYGQLSPADNVPSVWALRPGAPAGEELVTNAYSPTATRDGQTIVFSRVENNRRGIWRADRDGRGAVEIGTSAAGRVALTPDGLQALYLSLETGVQAAWITPMRGGTPRQLTKVYTYQPVVSPDGTQVAFVSRSDENRPVLAVCTLPDCPAPRQIPLERGPIALQWTPDGRELAYAVDSNIWLQPLEGGAPRPLTRFPEDDVRIEDFEWTADGRRLAFSRSRMTWDIVLFRGVAQEPPR